jgi:uncharacterized protein YcnI
VLDPAADEIQHSRKQRARIYKDEVYFTSRKPPENVPGWAINREKRIYETDASEYEDYEGDNEVDNKGGKEGDNEEDDEYFNLNSNEQEESSAAGGAAVS